ncbi:MAG: isoprenylcysteine carboxylmethyltransferase family protein, partial [Candidatus Thorarchaeota archaeon]|nr:isoprenylcysteine carboxylmethyltransferase family protein [Candidatus Thorarchaeota archaeon]
LDIIDRSYVALPVLLRYIGIILGIISIGYVYWAHNTLRQNYSATLETSEEQEVVREGPYARVRHPIYSSHMLFNFGMVLVSETWLLLLPLIIAMPFTYNRIFNEEKMMIEEFGEEYEEYMEETGRLFPKII